MTIDRTYHIFTVPWLSISSLIGLGSPSNVNTQIRAGDL
jgi:hypothetical protein